MDSRVLPFSDEQRRVLVNLELHYQVWIEAERARAAIPYGMAWKRSNDRDYLYELADRAGNGKSLGPRSPATEALHARYHADKVAAASRCEQSRSTLAETCAVYRGLRLPMIASEGAKVLREADRRGMLDGQLLVVGTNAMAVYSIEAGERIDAPDETQDFDFTWTAESGPGTGAPMWAMLKAVDGTYTVNSERIYQARNASAYEVELLVAPSRAGTMTRTDRPSPVALEEQEWLLLGRPVDHVVVARDGSPARIVAPDPRWFALQKLWLSVQDKRNPLKRPKDAKQGIAILNAVRATMLQYRLDAAFDAEIPAPLREHYARWLEAAPPLVPPTW